MEAPRIEAVLHGQVTFRRPLSKRLLFYDLTHSIRDDDQPRWVELLVKADGELSPEDVRDIRDSVKLGDSVHAEGSYEGSNGHTFVVRRLTVVARWRDLHPDTPFQPQPGPRPTPPQQHQRLGGAAAAAPAVPDADDEGGVTCEGAARDAAGPGARAGLHSTDAPGGAAVGGGGGSSSSSGAPGGAACPRSGLGPGAGPGPGPGPGPAMCVSEGGTEGSTAEPGGRVDGRLDPGALDDGTASTSSTARDRSCDGANSTRATADGGGDGGDAAAAAGTGKQPPSPPLCKFWAATGRCPKGGSCRYDHPPERGGAAGAQQVYVKRRRAERLTAAADQGFVHEASDAAKRRRAAVFGDWLVQTYGREFLNSGTGVLDVAGGRGALTFHLLFRCGVKATLVEPRTARLSRSQHRELEAAGLQPPTAAAGAAAEDGDDVETGDGGGAGAEAGTGAKVGYREGGQLPQLRRCFEPALWRGGARAPAAKRDDPEAAGGGAGVGRGGGGGEAKAASGGDGGDAPDVAGAAEAADVRRLLADCSVVVGLHPDQATDAILDFALEYDKPFAVVPCCVFPRLFPHRRLLASPQPAGRPPAGPTVEGAPSLSCNAVLSPTPTPAPARNPAESTAASVPVESYPQLISYLLQRAHMHERHRAGDDPAAAVAWSAPGGGGGHGRCGAGAALDAANGRAGTSSGADGEAADGGSGVCSGTDGGGGLGSEGNGIVAKIDKTYALPGSGGCSDSRRRDGGTPTRPLGAGPGEGPGDPRGASVGALRRRLRRCQRQWLQLWQLASARRAAAAHKVRSRPGAAGGSAHAAGAVSEPKSGPGRGPGSSGGIADAGLADLAGLQGGAPRRSVSVSAAAAAAAGDAALQWLTAQGAIWEGDGGGAPRRSGAVTSSSRTVPGCGSSQSLPVAPPVGYASSAGDADGVVMRDGLHLGALEAAAAAEAGEEGEPSPGADGGGMGWCGAEVGAEGAEATASGREGAGEVCRPAQEAAELGRPGVSRLQFLGANQVVYRLPVRREGAAADGVGMEVAGGGG